MWVHGPLPVQPMTKPALVLLLTIALAGCASDPPQEGEGPRVSEAGSAPEVLMHVVLLDTAVQLTPAGAQSWEVLVPANATNVEAEFTYRDTFFHRGIHLSLAGCGTFDFDGPGGSIGVTPGTWTYPVCDSATAGTQPFSIAIDAGVVDATVQVTATVPRA